MSCPGGNKGIPPEGLSLLCFWHSPTVFLKPFHSHCSVAFTQWPWALRGGAGGRGGMDSYPPLQGGNWDSGRRAMVGPESHWFNQVAVLWFTPKSSDLCTKDLQGRLNDWISFNSIKLETKTNSYSNVPLLELTVRYYRTALSTMFKTFAQNVTFCWNEWMYLQVSK